MTVDTIRNLRSYSKWVGNPPMLELAADALEAGDAQVLRAIAQVNKLNADVERLRDKIQEIGDYAASCRTGPALREALRGIEELCVEALTPNADVTV